MSILKKSKNSFALAHPLLIGAQKGGLTPNIPENPMKVNKMTRRHCSKKDRKIMKFRENYDEDYDWEDYLDDRNTRKKNKKPDRKNPMKDSW